MMSLQRIRYAPNGQPMGVDLNTVIELVKLSGDANPLDTIEKTMLLSRELIQNGN